MCPPNEPKVDRQAVAELFIAQAATLNASTSSDELPMVIRSETEFVTMLRQVLEKIFHVRWYRVAASYSPGIVSIIQNCYIACKFSGAISCRDADISKWLFATIVAIAGVLTTYCTGGFARNYDKEICKFCGIPRSQKTGSRSIAKAMIRVFFNCLAFVEMIKTILKVEGNGEGMECMSSYMLTAWWTLPAGFVACALLSAPQMWLRFGPSTSYAPYGDKLTALSFVAAGYIKSLVPSVSKLMRNGVNSQIIIEMVLGGFGSIFRYISQMGFNQQRREKLEAAELTLHRSIIPAWNKRLNKTTQCSCCLEMRNRHTQSREKLLAATVLSANASGGYFFANILEFAMSTMILLFCDPDNNGLSNMKIILYCLFGLFILLLFIPAGITRNFRYLFGETPESTPIIASQDSLEEIITTANNAIK